MIRRIPVVLLMTAVAGCSDAATGPVARRLTPLATVDRNDQRTIIETTGVFPVPRGCTGEPVEWTLRQEAHLHETIDPNGGFHGSFEFHDMGSYGVGLVTGAMYRLAQTQNETFQVGADGLPMTDTAIFLRRFISQGSINNFRVRALFHFTIDANGNLTASFDSTERICD